MSNLFSVTTDLIIEIHRTYQNELVEKHSIGGLRIVISSIWNQDERYEKLIFDKK